MFLGKFSFVLMIALLWTLTLLSQSKQMSVMVRPQAVPVPDFTGKTLQQVEAEAVVPGTAKPLFAGIYPQGPSGGVVVSQTPAAHTPVVPGSTRLLLTVDTPKPSVIHTILQQIVSPRQNTVRVPQLEGDNRDVASRLLEAARLRGTFAGDMGGVVTQQSPLAGSPVAPGSTVIVTLAVPLVIVPSLYGKTLEQAMQTLDEGSLQRGTLDGENTQGSTVTSQSPTAGTHVPPGTPVAVTMALAQQVVLPQEPQQGPPVFVPNLAKMSRGDAEAALASVGLRTGQVMGPSTGFVSDQVPTAGNTVDAGTSVDFTLLAATAVVPDVIKESEAVAEDRLKDFGLQAKISHAEDWNANAVHVVVEQRPSAGTIVDVGSSINVVIGNMTLPPTWWKRVYGDVVAAVPLVPWWMWLAIGVPLGAVGAGGIGKILGRTPNRAPPARSVACTLTATKVVVRTRVGHDGGPAVRFTVGLRDRGSVAQCRVNGEPAVKRKG